MGSWLLQLQEELQHEEKKEHEISIVSQKQRKRFDESNQQPFPVSQWWAALTTGIWNEKQTA